MARPKVHEHERRSTGLRLSVPIHDALRKYNRDTGVPMAKVIEIAIEEKMTELGYYDPEHPEASITPEAGVSNGTSAPAATALPKRAVVAKKGA